MRRKVALPTQLLSSPQRPSRPATTALAGDSRHRLPINEARRGCPSTAHQPAFPASPRTTEKPPRMKVPKPFCCRIFFRPPRRAAHSSHKNPPTVPEANLPGSTYTQVPRRPCPLRLRGRGARLHARRHPCPAPIQQAVRTTYATTLAELVHSGSFTKRMVEPTAETTPRVSKARKTATSSP